MEAEQTQFGRIWALAGACFTIERRATTGTSCLGDAADEPENRWLFGGCCFTIRAHQASMPLLKVRTT